MNIQSTRPMGVTILAAASFVAFVLAILHFLQALGILPYFVGRISVRDFNLWYALMWGLMIWVWWWVTRALLLMDPSAWLFLVLISGLNLTFDFLMILTSETTLTDLSLSFLVNLGILAYALMPGTKRQFGVET